VPSRSTSYGPSRAPVCAPAGTRLLSEAVYRGPGQTTQDQAEVSCGFPIQGLAHHRGQTLFSRLNLKPQLLELALSGRDAMQLLLSHKSRL
jgi:hypothetical protein